MFWDYFQIETDCSETTEAILRLTLAVLKLRQFKTDTETVLRLFTD